MEYQNDGESEFVGLNDKDIRQCPGCHKEMDKYQMEEIYDNQGIYAGRYCTMTCAEKNSGLKLHRTNQEAYEAGDW